MIALLFASATTLDADNQALRAEVARLDADNQARRAEVARLTDRLARVEALIASLAPSAEALAGRALSEQADAELWLAGSDAILKFGEAPAASGASISLTAGGDLDLHAVGGAVTVGGAAVQQRVSGTCAVGSSIQSVNGDGTVTCEAVGNGPPGPPGSAGSAGRQAAPPPASRPSSARPRLSAC